MKPEDILDSLGGIDDSILIQAEMPLRRRSYKGLITIGIAAAIFICVSILPLAMLRGEAPAEPPKIPSEIFDREDKPSVLLPAPSDSDDNDSSVGFNSDENSGAFYPDADKSEGDEAVDSSDAYTDISAESNITPPESSAPPENSSEENSDPPDFSSNESSSLPESSDPPENSDSTNDYVPYDGPIYKVYDDYDGEPYLETDMEPPNYVGTLDADKSQSLNMILSSLQTTDNRVYSVLDSVSNVWDVLRSLGYDNNYILQFKSTDRKHSYEIYEHDSDGTYILRNGSLLYYVTPEEIADIRELIKHFE